jgi:hypothetical protein
LQQRNAAAAAARARSHQRTDQPPAGGADNFLVDSTTPRLSSSVLTNNSRPGLGATTSPAAATPKRTPPRAAADSLHRPATSPHAGIANGTQQILIAVAPRRTTQARSAIRQLFHILHSTFSPDHRLVQFHLPPRRRCTHTSTHTSPQKKLFAHRFGSELVIVMSGPMAL